MLKSEIKVGGLYLAKVSGIVTTVRVDNIHTATGATRDTTLYDVTNLRTGRKTTFRSAAKFRAEVKKEKRSDPTVPPAPVPVSSPEEQTRPFGQGNSSKNVSDTNQTSAQDSVVAQSASLGQGMSELDTTQAEDEQEPPFAQPTTQTVPTPTNLPTTDGTATPVVDHSTHSEQSGTVQSAKQSTQSEGEHCSDPTQDTPLATSAGVQHTIVGTVDGVTTGLAAKIASTHQGREVGLPVAGMVPNEEEESILAIAVEKGLRVLVVGAGAGTGKTATLKMLEQVLPGRGQYTAFNSSLVAESKAKFVKAACNTTHSLAFRAVGKLYQHRLDGERMRSSQIARILGIGPLTVMLRGMGTPDAEGKPTDKIKTLQAEFLAGQVLVAIRKFCQSADLEVHSKHFHYIDGIDTPLDGGKRGHENNDHVREYLLGYARKAWDDMTKVDGQLPFSHDVYVKIWQLGQGQDRPIIAANYILLDEAQDTAPVFLDVIQRQDHALLVLVGDENQCQPTGTLIKVVLSPSRGGKRPPTVYWDTPIESVQPGDVVASYDIPRSFYRRSGCKVDSVVVRPFTGNLVTVSVPSGETSSYTPNHKCVARVGDALNKKWAVYLMRKGQSFRIGKVKGMYETQQGGLGLPMRMRAENADAAWILDTYDSESDAMLCESLIAWSWGIPTLRFNQGTKYGITQEGLNEFWAGIGDLTSNASKMLLAFNRLVNYPLCTKDTTIYRNRGQLIHACNLIDGMLVLTANGGMDAEGKRAAKNKWSEVNITHRYYEGNVYSLKVSGDATYVADGIITHNSIYNWRGAVDAMKTFPDAPRRLLSQSYRFGQAVADVANTILATLDESTDLVMRGMPTIPSRVTEIANPRCYLYRTNAGAVSRVMVSVAAGKKPHLIGGSADVVAWCQAAMDLQAKRGTRHPELCCFENWNEVDEYSKTDEGGDLRLMVKLVNEFGAEEIRDALKDMPPEDQADLVVSTAHKSKGREWDTVKLGPDFPLSNRMTDSDRRLLYVAATRAKLTLDISECPPFCGGHDSRDTGNPETAGRSVPGLRINYTQPMPTEKEQNTWIENRKTTESAHSVTNTPVEVTTAQTSDVKSAGMKTSDSLPMDGSAQTAPTPPITNGNGQFTWCNHDSKWCVCGPKDTKLGEQVKVTRKNGSSSSEVLKSVVNKYNDAWIYGV